jgi:myo-inositol-1(or 4)-monophosphatase
MDIKSIISYVKEASKFVYDQELKSHISQKGAADYVTAVDLKISNFLKEKLYEITPDIGFMSEEEENAVLPEKRWILDPIDGTTNLIYGYNMSSVSLALYDNGKIVFGVVYNPFNDECFTAELGKGAYLNGNRISVSTREMKDSIIEFGAGSTRKQDAKKSFELGKAIFERCIDIRRICSSALDLCFIAAGRIDGYFETKIKPWDYAAGSLILSEAGGKTSDYDNQSLPFDKPSSIIASNGIIHDELHAIINTYR